MMNNTTGTTVPSFAQSDAVNLTKAKRNHGELMDMLDHLSGKLSHVSSTVDKEFLSAYRVHMLSVQAELKSLKNDVSKGEQMLNSDAQVAKLEKESKWFSDECAGLKQHFEAMTKDSKQMRQRLLDMAEQRNFLCDQLKALLKRNKVLEAEIYQLKNGGDLQSLSISMGSASFYRSQKGGVHDDHSSISNRYNGKKNNNSKQQPAQTISKQQQSQNQISNTMRNDNNNSKVRFGPPSTGAHDEDDMDDMDDQDPMAFLEEEEDEELAFMPQKFRTQQLRQSRQESGLRISVSAGDRDDDEEGSSPALSHHASTNRIQLPPPLQRAMASGRGDSLFNVRPTSSSGPTSSTSPPRNLRQSQSAVALGNNQSLPSSNNKAPTMYTAAGNPMAQSMPVLSSLPPPSGGNNQSMQQETQQRQEKMYKSELDQLIGQRPMVEIALEQAIRDIFTEVRHRKKNASLLCSTKRSTGVTFSGGVQGGKPPSPGATGNSMNPWSNTTAHNLPKGMQEIVQELNAQDEDVDPEPGADGARLIKLTPAITQRGGIAGLGTIQFSENDRFATMVKYLAQPEVFEKVSDRLWDLFYPPTEEELRASGQYLGSRPAASPSAAGPGGRRTRSSPSGGSRSNSPVAR